MAKPCHNLLPRRNTWHRWRHCLASYSKRKDSGSQGSILFSARNLKKNLPAINDLGPFAACPAILSRLVGRKEAHTKPPSRCGLMPQLAWDGFNQTAWRNKPTTMAMQWKSWNYSVTEPSIMWLEILSSSLAPRC